MPERPEFKSARTTSVPVSILSPLKLLLLLPLLLLLSGREPALAQAPSCPETSTTSFTFIPQALGDSLEQTIALAPCETIEIHESHDMLNDGNRGTNVKISFLNESGQELYSQTIFGFFSETDYTFPDRDSPSEPFPWVGVSAPVVLPYKIKVESKDAYGRGSSQQKPEYNFTIIRRPRPGVNVGGYSFSTAAAVSSFPATYRGSLRDGRTATPLDPGQYFKVHLQAGQSLYATGTAYEETYYGANFTIDVYDANAQLLTPNGWVNTVEWEDHPANFTSGAFTNTGSSAADFYVRLWSRNWPVELFKMTLSVAAPVTQVDEDPLIFIPGIGGSRLREVGRAELWPGLRMPGPDRAHLTLDPTQQQFNVIATDVVRDASVRVVGIEVTNQPVYGPLLNALTTRGGYREYQVRNDPARRTTAGCDLSQRWNDPTLFVFAYDWRKSSVENAQALKDYIGCVQRFYPNKKVDLLAHSMGGLVSRRYILDNTSPRQVNRLITVATPWLGAPKAINVLETGAFDQINYFVAQDVLRQLAEFFPGVHQLIPSRSYFSLGGRPFGEESWDVNGSGRLETTYNTYPQLINTLDARHPRGRPGTADRLFHDHAGQDDWRTDSTGVSYFHVYGVQRVERTIGKLLAITRTVCDSPGVNCHPVNTFRTTETKGDGTVPTLSAERKSGTTDLNAPGHTKRMFSPQGNETSDAVEHTGLTQNPRVQDYILSILGRGQVAALEDEPPVMATEPAYFLSVVGVDHVGVTDAAGNTSEPDGNEPFAATVPGVAYELLGGGTVSVAMPADQNYTLTFRSGNDPLFLELLKGTASESPTQAVRYQDLKLPPNVKAMIQVTPQGVENLRYDADGDGTYESTVTPTTSLDGLSAQDVTPPSVSVGGVVQSDDRVLVTVTAADAGSGLGVVRYSLDNETFQTYSSPILLDHAQTPYVYAFADDQAGNRSGLITYRLPARKALMVTGPAPLGSGDGAVKSRLESLGYVVTVVPAASVNAADAAGKHLIVISSTAAPADVNTKFRDVPVPVITWSGAQFSDLGMTGSTADTDYGTQADQDELTVVNATHPLAAGLTGTFNVSDLLNLFKWGVPGTAGAKVATLAGDQNKSVVFGYEGGASMPGSVAPARRVGFFLGDDAGDSLNGNGWALFDAAANWASGAVNSAPTVSVTQPAEGTHFNPASNITVSADAADTDGVITEVKFYAGQTLVGTDTSSPYSVTWIAAPAGDYALTAVAKDDSGAVTTSSPVNITVNLSSGIIAGTVRQPDGTTPVAGASLSVYSGETLVASTSADGSGLYSFAGLDPGTYSVHASAPGFEPQTQGGVAVANNTTATVNFTLAFALPVINSLSPSVGTVGTAVTVGGENFISTASSNTVKFNGTTTVVSAASTTSLTTSVPTGATSGRVTVTTPSGTSTSTADFFVAPSPYAAADVAVTGRMAVGESKTVTINTANKIALVVFDGTASQRVSLKVTGVSLTGGNGYLDVYVKKPDGSTLVSQSYVGSGGGFIDVTTLPSDGSYTIIVDPQDTGTGSATLTLYDVPADLNGSITPGGSAVTMTTTAPGQNAGLSFNGAANQRVSLKITNVSVTGGNGYADVRIRKPDGTTLVSENYVGSGGAFVDVQTLPASGAYSIVFDPQIAGTGSATFTLYDVPTDASSTITVGGAAVTLTTTVPGQNATATFDGTASQRMSLKVTGVSLTGGNGYLDVYVKKPDGSTFVSQSYVGSGGGFIDMQTLPTTGTYTVFVNPHIAGVGSATLTLYEVPADLGGTLTTDGSSLTLTTTTPGQNSRPTFEGTAGQRVSLKVTGVSLTGGNGYLDVYLKKPDGTTLASQSYVGSGGGFIDVQTLPSSGTYTVLVDPQDTGVGSATLALYEVPADSTGAASVNGGAVAASNTVPGQNARVTFDGTSAQQVTVRLTGSTMGWVTVNLLKPDGSTLTSYTSYGSASFDLAAQTLPTTGTYTVLVDPLGANTGSVNVSVTNP